MNRDMIRIEKMKEDRANLLKQVRENIVQNGKSLTESLDDLIDVLDFDDKCVKKYESIVKSQNLIYKFTNEIVRANSNEEIVSIRKRLNYYINKIKKEIKDRNLSCNEVSRYNIRVFALRKNVSKYLRLLRRQNILNTIDSYYQRYDSLKLDELKEYKKILKREIDYNRSVNHPSKLKLLEGVNHKSTLDNVIIKKDIDLEKDNSKKLVMSSSEIEKIKNPSANKMDELDISYITDYLDTRVESFSKQYQLVSTFDYNKFSLPGNIIKLLRNIPRYIHNKHSIKKMKNDFCMYYKGGDLHSFIEYSVRRNSIQHALRCIFDKSYLHSKANSYLNDHNMCSEWLYDYCRFHSITLSIPSDKQYTLNS